MRERRKNRKDSHMETEAENGVFRYEPRNSWGHQNRKRQGRILPRAFGRSVILLTP